MAATAKTTRNRQPSPFTPTVKVTVSYHKSIISNGTTPVQIGEDIADAERSRTPDPDEYATRVVSRSRVKADGSHSEGPASVMVYVAPKGYEFAAAKAESAMAILKRIAADRGTTVEALLDALGKVQ